MKHTLKDKLRIAGISLKDIAKATNTHHSAVCTVLDEELRKKVEAKAKVKEKKKEEKKKNQQRCTKIKSDGMRCKMMVNKPKKRCHYHD